MKINIEIDCTPEEARRFLGLPDVAPMQKEVMEMLQERLTEAIRAADSKALMDQWLPLGLKSLEQWQTFWSQLASAATGMGQQQPPRPQGGEDRPTKGPGRRS